MNRAYVSSALAAAVALVLATPGGQVRAADPAMEQMMKESEAAMQAGKIEKCYGVAKAGKNDCQTATASCAGSSTQDFDKSAFIALPTGTCDKLAGGNLTSS
jgi:uncharacterized membrane protein